jgi:hypothetical protein
LENSIPVGVAVQDSRTKRDLLRIDVRFWPLYALPWPTANPLNPSGTEVDLGVPALRAYANEIAAARWLWLSGIWGHNR